MPTDFTAPARNLPFPLDRVETLEVVVGDDNPCGLPDFPEDSDEKVTVLFRLSLNEFVALASAIDAGSDIAYGADGYKVWWIWIASVMCASFCEEMAECLSDPESAFTLALAEQLVSNPALAAAIAAALPETGAAAPGVPLTTNQAQSDILPPNVRDEEGDCIDDALWGASLYLVQSGNRAIVDFFEKTEAATNVGELAGIVASAVPAAGPYASAAIEFADQIQETLQEGYAGAYTEDYENELACAIFCAARDGCELTPDLLMEVMESRLEFDELAISFGVLMARVGEGVFVDGEIADAAFYIYFAALRFGQKFLDVVGIRTFTDMLSLGADFLASDNWEVLCECGEPLTYQLYNTLPNFGGVLVDTVEFEYGVPFAVSSIDGGDGRFQVAIEADGDMAVEYTIVPDPTAPMNTGEISWIYVNLAGSAVGDVGPTTASDMPTPVDARMMKDTAIYGLLWAATGSFSLMVTLTPIV